MRNLGIVALCATLSGCAAYEAQQQQQRYDQEQVAQQNADAKCQSYGVAPGSPGYVQCRMNLDNQAAADEQQRRAIVGAYLLRR
jgi:hypothetical protein